MVSIQEESYEDWKDDVAVLCVDHWDELCLGDDIPLDVDWDVYSYMSEAGRLRCYTVRDEDKLAGYVIFFVCPSTHCKSSIQANQDALFLHPSYRNSTFGMQMIKFAEDSLREEGVQLVAHHAKPKHPALGKVLEHMGYEVSATLYAKRLDK